MPGERPGRRYVGRLSTLRWGQPEVTIAGYAAAMKAVGRSIAHHGDRSGATCTPPPPPYPLGAGTCGFHGGSVQAGLSVADINLMSTNPALALGLPPP